MIIYLTFAVALPQSTLSHCTTISSFTSTTQRYTPTRRYFKLPADLATPLDMSIYASAPEQQSPRYQWPYQQP